MSVSVLLFLFAAFATCVLTGAVMRLLQRRAIFDLPNDRSSHQVPTPRGGGLALVPVMLAGCAYLYARGFLSPGLDLCDCALLAMLGGAAVLALVSWWDDIRPNGLPKRVRIIAQLLAVAVPIYLLGGDASVTGFLPIWFERVALALAWLWFVNLYNFMDGINGITGIETLCIGLGLWLLQLYAPFGALLAGCAVGFLFWNVRGRIFLGDVGSIPLGYLIGGMLVLLTLQGYFWVAILLPLYHWVDATVTLLKRLLQGKKIWQPHREHFYQYAVNQGGHSHCRVAMMIGILNLLLILLVWTVLHEMATPLLALIVGTALLGVVLYLFRCVPAAQNLQGQ